MVSERGSTFETYAEARCNLTMGKVKGRMISWAFTTANQYASDKVLKVIARREAPTWCELKGGKSIG
jgi:hypothetical protein